MYQRSPKQRSRQSRTEAQVRLLSGLRLKLIVLPGEILSLDSIFLPFLNNFGRAGPVVSGV